MKTSDNKKQLLNLLTIFYMSAVHLNKYERLHLLSVMIVVERDMHWHFSDNKPNVNDQSIFVFLNIV